MPTNPDRVKAWKTDPLAVALRGVFQHAQEPDVSVMKSVNRFRKLYAQTVSHASESSQELEPSQQTRTVEKAESDFWRKFRFLLQLPITMDRGTEANTVATKYLEVAAKLAAMFLEEDQKRREEENKDKEGEGDPEEEPEFIALPTFFHKLIHWLLDNHEVEGNAARLRITLMINHLLKLMGEDASIDDDLYNKIYDNMLLRLRDKVVDIRSQAVTALQRLQDPKENSCPIINAFLFHMANDPSPAVRRTVVRCIGASRLTLPHVLKRTKDVDESVRKAAFKFIADKIHIRSLTIAQREQTLQRGLSDRSEGVRMVVERSLVPAWLRLNEEKVVQLLYALDVGNSEDGKVASDMLKVLFGRLSYNDVAVNFEYVDNNKLVPYDKLLPEVAVYWKNVTAYLHKEGGGATECLEKLLPELSEFCQYVRHYILELNKTDDDVSWLFVSKQLIEMFSVFDLADEVGRNNLLKLCKDLLAHKRVTTAFVEPLMNIFSTIRSDVDSRITEVAEIIAELRDPMKEETMTVDKDEEEDADAAEDNATGDADDVTQSLKKKMKQKEAENRKKAVEIANVKVQLNIMQHDLEEAIQNQDFIRAQEIKTQMGKLDEEQNRLEDELTEAAAMAAKPVTPKANVPVEVDETNEDSSSQANKPLDDDPEIVLKCLEMIYRLLQDPKIRTLNPTLQTLLTEFIDPAARNATAGIRKAGVKALGACCNRNLDMAKKYLLVLFQMGQFDQVDIRLVALAVVNDLLMFYGLPAFIGDGELGDDEMSNVDSLISDQTNRPELTQANLDVQGGNSVVATLTHLLDDPDLEIRTKVAEGLCKLLMIGAISSAKLFQRLILMWYNPMAESDGKLRHVLGTFFPLFASMKRMNQDTIEEAFVPTLQTLIAAPPTSPLSSIDLEDVGMFFVQITREDFLQAKDSQGPNVHDDMAFSLVKQVLAKPDGAHAKSFLKLLLQLHITNNDFPKLRELKKLQERMLEAIREKIMLKTVEKFGVILTEWLKADPNPTGENEETELNVTKKEENEEEAKKDEPEEPEGMLNMTKANKRRLLFNHNNTTLLSPAVLAARGASDDVDSASSNDVFLSPKPPTPISKPKRPSAAKKTRIEESSDDEDDEEEVIVSSGNFRRKGPAMPTDEDMSSIGSASQETPPIACSTQVVVSPPSVSTAASSEEEEDGKAIKNFLEKDAVKPGRKLRKAASSTEGEEEEKEEEEDDGNKRSRRGKKNATPAAGKKTKKAPAVTPASESRQSKRKVATPKRFVDEEEVEVATPSESSSSNRSTKKSRAKKTAVVEEEETPSSSRRPSAAATESSTTSTTSSRSTRSSLTTSDDMFSVGVKEKKTKATPKNNKAARKTVVEETPEPESSSSSKERSIRRGGRKAAASESSTPTTSSSETERPKRGAKATAKEATPNKAATKKSKAAPEPASASRPSRSASRSRK